MKRYRFIIGAPAAVTLYAENNHPEEDPKEVFEQAVATFGAMQQTARETGSPLHSLNTTLTRFLLKERYRTDGGNHQAGDRMFIVPDEIMPVDEELQVSAGDRKSQQTPVITFFCESEDIKQGVCELLSDIVGIEFDGECRAHHDNYGWVDAHYVSRSPGTVHAFRNLEDDE